MRPDYAYGFRMLRHDFILTAIQIMADQTQENKTTETNATTETAAPAKSSRLPTFLLMGAVAIMAASTVGYIAINAPNAQEAGDEAAAQPLEENPVVAKIDGTEYRAEKLQAFVDTLPPQVRQVPLQFIYPSLIQQFANLQLATEEAYRQGLDSDAEVQKAMQLQQDRIVREVLLDRLVAEAVTDEAIDSAYNEFLLSNNAETEVKARHILVETEDEAEAIITELDGGADFAALASEHSTGPSSSQGGDLGYFTRDRMVKPFADAAFGLEVGAYTEEPVQTEFGYHVILVEDRRESEPPSKEEMREQLHNQIAASVVQDYFTKLREGKDIELFGIDGKLMTDETEEPAANQ